MKDYKSIENLLKANNQEHIIDFLNKLDGDKKDKLIRQIEKLQELYENTKREVEIKENIIETIKYSDKEKLSYEERNRYDSIGEQIIKSNKYIISKI